MPTTAEPGALPTYLRIAERLTIDIGGGRLSAGEKLPPERQMAAELGVAVATLRKALRLLEQRGLISRRQGSGNYVLGGKANIGTYALFRLELKPEGGGLPTARLLEMGPHPIPADIPHFGSQFDIAIRIRRLRSLSEVPVAVEEIWLDYRWHDDAGLTPRTISESLYRTYQERLGLTVSRVRDEVSAATLPDWAPPALGLQPGAPAGFVERRAHDQHGLPCEFSRTWFNPSIARYYARVP